LKRIVFLLLIYVEKGRVGETERLRDEETRAEENGEKK